MWNVTLEYTASHFNAFSSDLTGLIVIFDLQSLESNISMFIIYIYDPTIFDILFNFD